MTWQTILYFSSVVLTSLLTGFLAWYAWRQPHVAGARSYAYMVLAESLLALTEIGVMLVGTEKLAAVWFSLRVPFTAVIPVFWLFFALEYSGRGDWLSKAVRAALFAIPLLTQVVMVTSGVHGLWLVQDVGFEKIGPFWIAATSARIPGIWYLVHTFYSTLVLLAGAVILVVAAWRKPKLLLGQALLVSLGALTALGLALVGVFNVLPELRFNPFVPGIGFSAVCYALAIFRFRFLKHTPAQGGIKHITSLGLQEKQSLAGLVLIFILFTSGIAAIGYFSYKDYEQGFRAQVENQLVSIADLKVSGLETWRAERLEDGEAIYNNPAFGALVQRVLENPEDLEAGRQLQAWLDTVSSAYEYDRVFLMDLEGVERFASPSGAEPVAAHLVDAVAGVSALAPVTMLDFHLDTTESTIHLSVVVPVFTGADHLQPLGLLVLRIDPAVYLYPSLQNWPVPSQSAETLLVRRDGETVLYLNDLKFDPEAALNLRIPLENTDALSVRAVLGETGFMEGTDYRGAAVIGYARPVPDSLWYLIARIDVDEVYAPLTARVWQTLVFLGVLILMAGTGLTLLWRQQRVRYFRAQVQTLEALRVSEEKFRKAFLISPDSVVITRLSDGMFVSVNQGFTKILGYTEAEVLGKSSLEIDVWVDPQDRKNIVAGLQEKGVVENYEAHFRTKQGGIIYGLMSAVVIELDGEAHILNTTRDITERKRADAALRESEEKFSKAFRSSPAALLITTLAEGRFVDLNAAYSAIVGYERAELIGRLTTEFNIYIKSTDRQAIIEQLLVTGSTRDFETSIRHRSGEIRHVLASQELVTFNGEDCIMSTFLDITGRKQIEIALQESEGKYRLLAENISDVIWILDAETSRFCYVSPSVEHLRGYTVEEVLAQDVAASFTPASAQYVANVTPPRVEEFKQGILKDYIDEVEQPVKDGTTVWTEVTTRYLLNTETGHMEVYGVSRNITERKQVENALRESEAKFRKAFMTSPDSININRLQDGMYISINPGFTQIMGYTEADAIGKTSLELNIWGNPEDRQRLVAGLRKDGVVENLEACFRRKDGGIRYGLMSASVIELDGIPHILSITRDITERKQAEDALRISEKALRESQRIAHVGNWSLNVATNQVVWSEELYKMYGFDPAVPPPPYTEHMKLFTPESWERLSTALTNTRETGVPYELVLEMVRKDGSRGWMWMRGEAEVDPKGKIVGLWGAAQDITERKQAEETLHQLNDRLALAQRLAGAGVWDWDLATGKLNWTPEFFSLFGLDPAKSEATFDTWRGALHPNDLQGAEQRINEAIRDHVPLFNEYRIVTPSGETRWIGAWGDTTYNEGGETLSMTGLCIDITERKRAEEALRESEEKFRKIVEGAPDPIFIQTKNNFAYLNPAARRLFHINSANELIGTPVIERIHPDYREKVRERIRRLNIEHRPVNEILEQRYLRMDGSTVWVETKGEPIVYEGENGALIFVRDISERKQAEDALRASEQNYRILFDEMLSGFAVHEIICDTGGTPVDYRFLAVNAAFEKLTGLRAADLLGKTIKEALPGTEPAWIERYGHVALTREDIQFEDYSSSLKKYFEVRAFSPELGKFATIFNDITERKQAEEALTESRRLMQDITDNSAPLIYAVDTEGRFLLINRKLESVLGTSREVLLGKTRAAVLPVEIAAIHRANDRKVIETRQPISVDEENQEADGKHTYLSYKFPLFDAKGNVYGVGGISTDITERKQAEVKVRMLNVDLEQRVEDRTRELRAAQEKLVRQERLAVLGQLAGSVGHELRNPLGVISNAAYFLKMTQPKADEKTKEYLQIIENETHTAEKIITDLLDFSRIKSLDRESVDVTRLVEQTLARYPAPAGVKVTRRLGRGLPRVFADPRQMVQVLGNLLENAYQAMEATGKVTVSARQEGQMVTVTIADSGPGINPENLEKVFEPLFTTKIRGIGLGLAVSQRFVEANGGKIEVRSASSSKGEAGKGAAFTVSLPVYKESHE